MADAAIVSSILGGFLRGLDESMREVRDRRAQVYLQAIQQNPALARTDEGQAALRSVGISPEEIPALFPTPQERLQAAIPTAAAALGQAPLAGTPQFPPGLSTPGVPTVGQEAGIAGVAPTVDAPTAPMEVEVPEGTVVGLDGQLRPLFQNIPAGTTLEIDPVSGSLKITRRGPDVPSKPQADEPAVFQLFQNAVMALRQAFPAAPDIEVVQRAAAETVNLAAKQGLIVPESIQKVAFAKFDTERELAAREAAERIALYFAQERAQETAIGTERGRKLAREAAAREALTGAAAPSGLGAPAAPSMLGVTPQGAPQAAPQAAPQGAPQGAPGGTAPPAVATTPPAPTPSAPPAVRMPDLDPDMDSPPWVAEAARAVQPGRAAITAAAPGGYVIGAKLGEQDIADAASFGLVLARQPTGEWIAVPRTVAAQRKLDFEEPAVIAAARAGLRALKDRTAMQTSAATARRVLDSVQRTKATSLLLSFGLPIEEIQKNPMRYLAKSALLEGKAQVNRLTIRMLARAGDPRAVALKALQGVATPFIKALGEVGQITEPDKAVIYNLLQRVWRGDAFREEADQTIDYLLQLMQTIGQATNISPAMARIMLNTDPRDKQAADAALQNLRSAVEDSMKAPPGTIEASGLLESLAPEAAAPNIAGEQ